MAPSCRSTRKSRGTLQKKQLDDQSENTKETSLVAISPVKSFDNSLKKMDDKDHFDFTSNGCSTPKAQKFRIPKISTCPRAPKKQRVVSNCSLRRTPIAFFSPPDIELFFSSHLAALYRSKFVFIH